MTTVAAPDPLGSGVDVALVAGPYVVGLVDVPREMELGDTYLGFEVLSVNKAIDFIVVDVTDPVAFNLRAMTDENVLYHHFDDAAFTAYVTPNDTYFNCCQWGIKDIGVQTAWDTTMGATSVKLAVLDTGMRKTHEDIGNYLQGWDFISNDNDPEDGNGHGTHVASTAAGLTNNAKGVAGVAQVTILPVRVLNNAGSGTFSQISNGITWAADQGVKIISMSLGASSGTTELQNAVNYATNSGALVISAAGNENGPVGYPAKYANSMAVAAYDQNRNKATFSNFGPEIDVAAPGVQIAAAYNRNDADYVYLDGTSMATPIVSGTAALGLSKNPALTNTQLRNLLTSTATDLGPAGKDNSFGYGGVNAAAVVANAGGGGGGGGETTVYFENFESTTQFTKSSGTTDWWRLSSGCLGGNTGRSLQYNRADTNCIYGSGTSRVTGWARAQVDLSGATSATLKFDHKWTTESYAGGAYDIMRVQIASCSSCTWTTLQQWDSRNANQASWLAQTYDVSAWAGGSTVNVRFFFDSVDGSSNSYAGWAVDNFHVLKG